MSAFHPIADTLAPVKMVGELAMYLEDERLTPCIDATLACYRSCFSTVSAGPKTSS